MSVFGESRPPFCEAFRGSLTPDWAGRTTVREAVFGAAVGAAIGDVALTAPEELTTGIEVLMRVPHSTHFIIAGFMAAPHFEHTRPAGEVIIHL